MTTVEKIEAFKDRTKQFTLRIIKLYQNLPNTGEAKIIGDQLIRSATSVAANYRAAARNRSAADRISKLSIVTEEADETLFWLEILIESKILPAPRLIDIKQEAEEIVKILSTTLYNLKAKKK
jgi:four helix bundle protein